MILRQKLFIQAQKKLSGNNGFVKTKIYFFMYQSIPFLLTKWHLSIFQQLIFDLRMNETSYKINS
jgi:hypothetical protein